VTNLAGLKVVLASSSPRRHDLLKLIGVDHEVVPADLDESQLPGEKPDAHAERLARSKAEVIAGSRWDALVIGADTIVVVDEHILGKPRDVADAARMLRMLSNRSHIVMTAVAVALGGRTLSVVEKVTVSFRDLTEDEIARYIASGEPMDKAGAFGIQVYGATIVRRVELDYFAVMGLSLVRLVDLMTQLGVRYDFAR
jgi:septum formation protein